MYYQLLDDLPSEVEDNLGEGYRGFTINARTSYGMLSPISPTKEDIQKKNIILNPLLDIDPNELNEKCGLPPAYITFKDNDYKKAIEDIFTNVKWEIITGAYGEVIAFTGDFPKK